MSENKDKNVHRFALLEKEIVCERERERERERKRDRKGGREREKEKERERAFHKSMIEKL